MIPEAVSQVARRFPHSDEIAIGIAKLLPVSAIDDIMDSLRRGCKLTCKDYENLIDVCEAAEKSADDVVKAISEKFG